ncbi:hypothetical protein C7441_112184 [Pseudaminobacter salicylatoxidans]|uniref:HK97 gp10 family phage protein n=1 Tax=Pseudaminobacter salicylatoxidans TaxID=93369 RepID=A0A316C4F1_PSESE|nr:HK97 gp10 family phage protein [Pseudaminobacter salicylatoxidans]PWJ80642.1 hypothetical protein C7441_112184 [Pseudaminobacter salicylatoxidans]
MAQQSFSAAVDEWVLKSQRRMLAMFQTATQYVIEDMIDRTRVDTGFLRASIVVSTSAPAAIREDARPVEGQKYPANEAYALVIAGAELGGTIWATYTASYAAYREYGTHGQAGDGMVRLAAQNWPKHVARATAEAKARVG